MPRIQLSHKSQQLLISMRQQFEHIGESMFSHRPPKNRQQGEIKSYVQGDELYLYDVIGPDLWDAGITAIEFAQMLPGDKSQPLTVRINSPGGDVFDGLAIYNLLKERQNVSVQIDGVAASIASVIALAGDRVTMAENTQYMIHNPYTIAQGDARGMREVADMLDQIKASLVDTYAAKSQQESLDIANAMDAETWYSAQDALRVGYADAVVPNKAKPKTAEVDDMAKARRAAHNRAKHLQRQLDLMRLT